MDTTAPPSLAGRSRAQSYNRFANSPLTFVFIRLTPENDGTRMYGLGFQTVSMSRQGWQAPG
jgi:hypothetical protein